MIIVIENWNLLFLFLGDLNRNCILDEKNREKYKFLNSKIVYPPSGWEYFF